jgi:hypothetical protein
LQRPGELTIKAAEGHPRVNPLVGIASQAMDDMRRIGAEFGLSPNARLRLSGITPPPPPVVDLCVTCRAKHPRIAAAVTSPARRLHALLPVGRCGTPAACKTHEWPCVGLERGVDPRRDRNGLRALSQHLSLCGVTRARTRVSRLSRGGLRAKSLLDRRGRRTDSDR